MAGQQMSKQELLRFKLTAHLRREENKIAIAERERQSFEDQAARLFKHIPQLLANEPGIHVTVLESFDQGVASNVGWLEIDIVGKNVKISPMMQDGKRVLEISGLEEKSYYFELEHTKWHAKPPSSYGRVELNDDFWFTKLAELVPN